MLKRDHSHSVKIHGQEDAKFISLWAVKMGVEVGCRQYKKDSSTVQFAVGTVIYTLLSWVLEY